jgi:N-hydroxyarylamine O-acetyltransferase
VNVDELLARIGLDERPPADLEGLRRVHRAYVGAVTYENLLIQCGEAGPLDDEHSVARVLGGAGGYCFALNGTLALLLTGLGFSVARHQAVVGVREPGAAPTNHLALLVDLGGERWLADAGLGEGFVDPLPLRPGRHGGEHFAWTVTVEPDGGWWVSQHEWGSFAGFRIAPEPSPVAAFAPHHERLSTAPDSKFVQTLIVQRPYDDRIVTLRARTLTERGPGLHDERVLGSQDDLEAVLRDRFALDPAALGPERLAHLWRRACAQHEAFLARPATPPT